MSNQTTDLEVNPTPELTRPDPQVLEKAQRRQFTGAYKQGILDEAERCTEPGQIGALLRREGLYSSHLSNWRRQQEQALAADGL